MTIKTNYQDSRRNTLHHAGCAVPHEQNHVSRRAALIGVTVGLFLVASTILGEESAAPQLPDVPRLTIPHASGKPVIDGMINKEEWADAAEVTLRINKGEDVGGSPAYGTVVRLKWDADALYVAFLCMDKDIKRLIKERRVDPGAFWGKDPEGRGPELAEMMLSPDGNLLEYVEFGFSPGGALADIRLTWPNPDANFPKINAWDAEDITWAVHLDGTGDKSDDVDQSWSVEIALGWSSLKGFEPKAGTVMRGNLYRADNSEEKAPGGHGAWSPTNSHFQKPARFGYLELGAATDS